MGGSPYVPVGKVVKVHGSDGELAVGSDEDLRGILTPGVTVWFIPPPDHPRSARVAGVRGGPKGPIIRVSGIDTADMARPLVGTTILVREDAIDAASSVIDADPVGIRVTDEDGRDLGVVTRLIVTGANDVWVLDGPLGEVLLPVIDDVVLACDHDAGTALVRLLPGLIDEDDA